MDEKETIVERIKNSKCIYPDCSNTEAQEYGLRVVLETPEGTLRELPDKTHPAPFCKYHGHIGVHLLAVITRDPDNLEGSAVGGPVDVIKIVETVLAARSIAGIGPEFDVKVVSLGPNDS